MEGTSPPPWALKILCAAAVLRGCVVNPFVLSWPKDEGEWRPGLAGSGGNRPKIKKAGRGMPPKHVRKPLCAISNTSFHHPCKRRSHY